MCLTANERLEREPNLRDFSTWPDIPINNISEEKRAAYLKNCNAMALILRGHRYVDIASELRISLSTLSNLKTRALAGPAEEPPPLRRALIPWEHVSVSRRVRSLPTFGDLSGARLSFQHLLQTVPGLSEKLDEVIRADLADDPYAHNLTPQDFHQCFLTFLDEGKHPHDQYPYTEPLLGYETLRAYYHKQRNKLQMEPLLNRPDIGDFEPLSQLPFYYGRELQLDEQTYDAQSTVYLEFEGEFVPLRVARFQLIIATDVDTNCHLGFYLALNGQCSQFDVLQLLDEITAPAELPALSIDTLEYPPGSAFPNCLGEEYARIIFDTFSLDNALSHHAESVSFVVCDQYCSTLRYSYPGQPTIRHVIERAIGLAARLARRFKSTSGRNPADPKKESKKNSKHPPAVLLSDLEDCIRIILVRDNLKRKPHLRGNSALDLCRHHFATMPLRLLPPYANIDRKPFELRATATVRWLKNEGRSPHVQFQYLRYQGRCLAKPDLVNNKVELRLDYRDIRVLHVYSLKGEYVGDIYAPKTWQRYPHSIKTRRFIFKYCKLAHMQFKDPLTEFFLLQLRRKNQPKIALRITELYREYTRFSANTVDDAELEEHSSNGDNRAPESEFDGERADHPEMGVPAWNPGMANAKR